MATSDPLCLSPNPALGELAVNIDTATKQMHSTPLRQSRRSWCESRKRKQAEASQNPSTDFKLHNFLKKKSLLRQGIPPILHVSPPYPFEVIVRLTLVASSFYSQQPIKQTIPHRHPAHHLHPSKSMFPTFYGWLSLWNGQRKSTIAPSSHSKSTCTKLTVSTAACTWSS